MNPLTDFANYQTRRQFFASGTNALGMAALATLLGRDGLAESAHPVESALQFAPKAKRVIYLHMVGGPSQMDLFDYKPEMAKWYDKDLPESIRKGQRLTTMTSGQARFPIAPSKFNFAQRGECGMWMNADLLPHLGERADDIWYCSSTKNPRENGERN